MKTTIYTMIVLFAFYANMLFAGGIKRYTNKPEPGKIELTIDLEKLAPVTPTCAEFIDGADLNFSPEAMVGKLSPVTPREVDFEDPSDLKVIEVATNAVLCKLAPVTPVEADFKE